MPRQGRRHGGRLGGDPDDDDDDDDGDDPRGPRKGPPDGPPNERENRDRGNQRFEAPRHSYTHFSENSSNPVVDQRIQKLSSKTLGSFDPDLDSVNLFCETLLTLVEMYGELSVIAAIPAALEGRAKMWFRAHGMPRATQSL